MKKLIWWGSVFWNAPRLHPVCNKPWDQTKQNATEHKDKNCLSLDAPLRYQFLVDALSARFDYVTINLRHRSRYENVLFENRELCLYRPGKMKIISIQSDTELLSLSRPCSSVCVERKTFVWVTIQGVWIQREKKITYLFLCLEYTLKLYKTRTHARPRLRKSPKESLRDSNVLYLPTQHTYVPQTPPTAFIYTYAKSVKSWGVHCMCGVSFRTLAPSGACAWNVFFFCADDLCVATVVNLYDLIWKIWISEICAKISNSIAFLVPDPESYTLSVRFLIRFSFLWPCVFQMQWWNFIHGA